MLVVVSIRAGESEASRREVRLGAVIESLRDSSVRSGELNTRRMVRVRVKVEGPALKESSRSPKGKCVRSGLKPKVTVWAERNCTRPTCQIQGRFALHRDKLGKGTRRNLRLVRAVGDEFVLHSRGIGKREVWLPHTCPDAPVSQKCQEHRFHAESGQSGAAPSVASATRRVWVC